LSRPVRDGGKLFAKAAAPEKDERMNRSRILTAVPALPHVQSGPVNVVAVIRFD
jgi:hypothetical protein